MWLPLNKCIMFLCSSFHKSISYSTLVCDHDFLSLTCGRLMRIPGSCLWETVETAFLQPDQLIITKGYRTRSRIHDLIQEIWHSFSFKQILLRGKLCFSPLASVRLHIVHIIHISTFELYIYRYHLKKSKSIQRLTHFWMNVNFFGIFLFYFICSYSSNWTHIILWEKLTYR